MHPDEQSLPASAFVNRYNFDCASEKYGIYKPHVVYMRDKFTSKLAKCVGCQPRIEAERKSGHLFISRKPACARARLRVIRVTC
jgi:hypothetical protein